MPLLCDSRRFAEGKRVFVEYRLSYFEVAAQCVLDLRAQRKGTFNQEVTQGAEKIREFPFGPIQHIAGEQAASWAEFLQRNVLWRTQGSPHLVELPRQQAPKDSVYVAGSVEVSSFAELLGVAAV